MDKSSNEIADLIKEFEAIPHVKQEVKIYLDIKEKELIKKRNTDLFKIKV